MQYRNLSGNLKQTKTLKPTKAKGDQEEVDVDFQEQNEDVCNISQTENTDHMYDSFESYSEVSTKKKILRATLLNCWKLKNANWNC